MPSGKEAMLGAGQERLLRSHASAEECQGFTEVHKFAEESSELLSAALAAE
jgi:hypothetical protein